jgi:soluble lytic murein transglycosylase-like protein
VARFVAGAVFGAALMLVAGAAVGLHAQDPQTDVQQAAAAAGVDAIELAGAANTVGVDPWVYARSEGLLESATTESKKARPPVVAASPPVLPAVSARVECIIARESGGANVANSRGSGAVGVLQYMPTTFAAHAAEMGHPEYSPWNPTQARAVAAHDLALGRRSQWTVGGC